MKGTNIFTELDEINEIIFVQNGTIDIGFEINKIRKFVIRLKNDYEIGAYNCTFNERSSFVYKCRTDCHGYFLRKNTWKELLDGHPYLKIIIQKQVQEDYQKKMI